jgi:hypothetical protein
MPLSFFSDSQLRAVCQAPAQIQYQDRRADQLRGFRLLWNSGWQNCLIPGLL